MDYAKALAKTTDKKLEGDFSVRERSRGEGEVSFEKIKVSSIS